MEKTKKEVELVEVKLWYQSRSLRIAVLQAILGMITVFVSNGVVQDIGYIAIVKSILDFLIRLDTTTTIV